MTTDRASTHAPVLGGVPRLDSDFTGREALLEQIHEALGPRAGARYVIGGGSGVGKSRIAAEYARRFGHHYDLVWWVPATTDIEAYRAYLRLAEHLGLPVSYEHVPRTVQAVRRALAHDPGTGRWLLVFDDAVDVEALATDYIPLGGQGRVLITTRDHRWVPRRPTEGQVVPRLTTAESLSLLRRVCPDRLDPPQAGERLAEHLEHLPLALAQVGAFLRDSALTTDEFLELFTERHSDLMSHMGSEDDHTAPLAAAWSIQAEELGREATDRPRDIEHMVLELVQLSAFLAPGPLSRSLFSRSWEPDTGTGTDRRRLPVDDERLGRVLAYMNEHYLASCDEEAGTFQPHALLRAVIRNSLSLEERLYYRGLAQTVLARTDPRAPTDPAHRTDYLQLYGHVKAANAWSSRDPAVRDLVLNVIDFLTEVGHYQDAISLSDQAVNAWRGDESRLLHARLRRSKIRRIHGEYGTALEEARDIHRGQVEREGAENDDALPAGGSLGEEAASEVEEDFDDEVSHRIELLQASAALQDFARRARKMQYNASLLRECIRDASGFVYTSETEDGPKVIDALQEVLEAFGLDGVDREDPIIGSYFQNFIAWTKKGIDSPVGVEAREKAQRALELKLLDKEQADVDAKQGEALARLVEALKDTPRAAMQVGSLLVVKTPEVLVARTLNQREMHYLGKNPQLKMQPETLLEFLREADAVASACTQTPQTQGYLLSSHVNEGDVA